MDVVTRCTILLLIAFFPFSLAVSGQVGVDYDLQSQKPARFENRTLASEKSNDGKKFKKTRHFIQNTVTHYNFYFNANNKLNEVIARAKAQYRDDYTQLLSFYNYSLEGTFAQKKELDSVIYKCTAGILIHDTRNDWIDNLYLLIGKSFFFRKTFDSAYITFQFLNFAFAPKESDGYDKPIGSNANVDEGGNNNIVSTVEKRNIAQKIFSLPPSRNEALVWQVRTYIARDQFPEAAALIAVLKKDPQFPPRLAPDLDEIQALWFYRRSMYDSAAIYLKKALPVAADNEERARWEYLIGQLQERSGDSYEAKLSYERAVKETYNPVLDVYARLNAIRQNKDTSSDYIQKNIDALVKMGRKDRYESYRDVIYYTAAQIELERGNTPGAEAFLLKCVKSSAGTASPQRNKAFLQLANLSFGEKKYRAAKNYYDSINLPLLSPDEQAGIPDRKKALAGIVAQLFVIERQDSLQRIALMDPAARDAYIKKLVRALRKQQGLRDEDQADGSGGPSLNNNNQAAPPDLFSSGTGSADWYFYNATLKAKGYSDFKAKWGNRPNVDNWQMSALASQQKLARDAEHQGAMLTDLNSKPAAGPAPISFKSLLDGLPLSAEKMQRSQDTIAHALFIMGKIYQEGLPDYRAAIDAYDSVLRMTSDKSLREESLLNLYYCYKKIGDDADADKVLMQMKKDFPNSKSTAMAANPDSVAHAADEAKAKATRQYDRIYNSFIEGRFDEALAEKKEADSLYGSTYWTPQLLYIESVYFIRSRQDARAGIILNSIKTKFPNTPMAEKATRLLDVLGRRKQIEAYLTNLKVVRASDSMDLAAGQPGQATQKPQAGNRNVVAPDRVIYSRDSTKKQPDTMQAAVLRAQADSLRNARQHRGKADSAQLAGKPLGANSAWALDADKPQSVVIQLDKVDPVYVTETKNAFDRYNQETYYSQALTIENMALNDSVRMVVISGFTNSTDALDYLVKARAFAPRNIVPWLPAGKYSFLIISPSNLQLLMTNKDMPGYRRFLSTAFPGKF
jgi:tetratricopeptide (TPR) repeat protein